MGRVTYRWVRRNEDKPHRCPECHTIPDRCRRDWAPRTRASCPACRVQWRMGVRGHQPWLQRARRREQRVVQRYGSYARWAALLGARIESQDHAS